MAVLWAEVLWVEGKQGLVHQGMVVGGLTLYPELESWKQPGRMEEEPCSAQDLKVQQLMVRVQVQVQVLHLLFLDSVD